MTKQTSEFLKYAIVPIVILAFFFLLILFYQLFELPSYTEIREWVKIAFASHGYWVVFIGALAEGILFANWYLPGSVVVVMGVVFGKENGLNVFWVLNLITLGFMITAILNYALGRYGWYRLLLKFGLKDLLEKTKKRVEKHGLKIIFGTYFHPNIGALTATSAGILKLPFKNFLLYSALALVAWNTLWGIVVYFSGPAIVSLMTLKNLILILIGWVVLLLFKFVWMKKKTVIPVEEEIKS